jgi:hypothetical protein
MENQIIAGFRKKAVVPCIVGGAIVVAIPIFIFVLTRFVYVLAVKEALAPAAAKKLAVWRNGRAELASRRDHSSSLTGYMNGWLPPSIRQVSVVLQRLNRRKDF